MEDRLSTLRDMALRHVTPTGVTPIPRIGLFSAGEPSLPRPTINPPMMVVVLQGAKRVMIGDRVLR